jgi:hypothetical protein
MQNFIGSRILSSPAVRRACTSHLGSVFSSSDRLSPEALGALELHWQPWDGKVRFHTIEAAGVHRAQTAFFAHQW